MTAEDVVSTPHRCPVRGHMGGWGGERGSCVGASVSPAAPPQSFVHIFISCLPSLPNPPLVSLPATPPLFPSHIIHLFWEGGRGGSSSPPANHLINSHLCLSPTIQCIHHTCTHVHVHRVVFFFNQTYCAAPFLPIVSSFFSFSSFKTFSGTRVRASFYLCGDISFPSSFP